MENLGDQTIVAEPASRSTRRRASAASLEGSNATRQQLIDAARPLFVRDGFKSVPIRAIADAAGLNSALIGYHFGGKEELFVAVYKASAEPVNMARLALFRAIEKRPSFTAREVIEAWLRPMLVGKDSPSGVIVADLALAMNVGNSDLYDRLAAETFEEVNEAFLALMERCLPNVARETLVWRLHFLIGSILIAARERRLAIMRLSRGQLDPHDRVQMLAELTAFATAGFEALNAPAGKEP